MTRLEQSVVDVSGSSDRPGHSGLGAILVAARIWRLSLLRTVVFSAAATALLGTLALLLPVFHAYETATYRYATFDLEVNHVLAPRTEAMLRSVTGPDGYASYVSVVDAVVTAGDRSVGRANLLLSERPDVIARRWLTEDLVVDAVPVAGADWLDISADLASALQLRAGDTLAVDFAGGQTRRTVRRILVMRTGFGAYLAFGPILAHLAAQILPTHALLWTTRPAGEVARLLASTVKGDSATVRTRSQVAATAASRAKFGARAGAVVGLLALAGIVLLALREAAALVRRNSATLALFEVLGARRRTVRAAAVSLETIALAVGVVAGYAFIAGYAYGGLLFPVLPPGYPTIVVACGLGVVLLQGITALTVLSRRLRTVGPYALTSGVR